MCHDQDDEAPNMTAQLAYEYTLAGEIVITIESDDRDLLYEINSLSQDGVEVFYPLTKAANEILNTVSIVLKDTILLAGLIDRLFALIKKYTKGDKSKCKTKIETRKYKKEIEALLTGREDSVSVDLITHKIHKHKNPKNG